jgi:hypothetical protein
VLVLQLGLAHLLFAPNRATAACGIRIHFLVVGARGLGIAGPQGIFAGRFFDGALFLGKLGRLFGCRGYRFFDCLGGFATAPDQLRILLDLGDLRLDGLDIRGFGDDRLLGLASGLLEQTTGLALGLLAATRFFGGLATALLFFPATRLLVLQLG